MKTLACLKEVNFFGVRHLSPSSSYHLIEYLNKINPKAVLIEGPIDAVEVLDTLLSSDVTLPVAILAYTNQLPVKTVLYPFAEYSPEYQGAKWAKEKGAYFSFIDLPTSVSIKSRIDNDEILNNLDEEELDKQNEAKVSYYNEVDFAYNLLANSFDDKDYDEYWESNFEQIENVDEYIEKLHIQSKLMREHLENKEQSLVNEKFSHNQLREKFMAKNILDTINKGYKPEEIVVITGAYHTSGLKDMDTIEDIDFDNIKDIDTNITLMPYSYYKLSNASGYGAGNKSPLYYELLWKCRLDGDLDKVSHRYLSKLARDLREKSFNKSTASTIESVRLAKMVSGFKNHKYPTYEDIKDSAIACIGDGSISVLAESLATLNIGTKIGFLKEGVSKTSIQDDFNRQLKKLNIEKYKKLVPEVLTLDIRENVKVKSEEKAFLDLNRSTFFNKLELLEIDFCKKVKTNQDSATWKEEWELKWSPEVEIKVIETILKGETIDVATAYEINDRLKNATTMSELAEIIQIAYNCNIVEVIKQSIIALDNLFVDNSDFFETCKTLNILYNIIRYKDLRRVSTDDCINIFKKMFIRARLLLNSASNCNNEQAEVFSNYVNQLYNITQDMDQLVDYDLFIKELYPTAFDDTKNPIASGVCFSILMEKNKITYQEINQEISRRLSVGMAAELGASWFMGVCKRNRYGLLSKIEIWRGIDEFLNSLDDEEFKRTVVFFRRIFRDFTSREKNGVIEILTDLWGIDDTSFAEHLLEELSDEENEILADLDEFDFEDLI